RIKLENEKREKSTQLENLTKNLELAKDDLQNEKQVLQQLLAEIEQMKKETEQKVLEIRSKAKQKRDHIQKVKGERMALQFLIKNKYIEFNEMKIIDSLKGRRNTDVNTIAKVTGLSPNLISQTLTGLMKRDLVNYDKDSGKIEVLSNLKI
ncbi:MAG: hypothetical protein U9O98_04370, partial [Asgard group archaeon]|nr:hypothetical protein [Asgard group archaeon]